MHTCSSCTLTKFVTKYSQCKECRHRRSGHMTLFHHSIQDCHTYSTDFVPFFYCRKMGIVCVWSCLCVSFTSRQLQSDYSREFILPSTRVMRFDMKYYSVQCTLHTKLYWRDFDCVLCQPTWTALLFYTRSYHSCSASTRHKNKSAKKSTWLFGKSHLLSFRIDRQHMTLIFLLCLALVMSSLYYMHIEAIFYI